MNEINWQQVRIDAAIAAMQALMTNHIYYPTYGEFVIETAIKCADELIAKLINE